LLQVKASDVGTVAAEDVEFRVFITRHASSVLNEKLLFQKSMFFFLVPGFIFEDVHPYTGIHLKEQRHIPILRNGS
jgi:hypothetical protein